MKVKAVQIARELGISKATVSLALNNRPGVSEQTRREILECRERLEKEAPHPEPFEKHPAPVLNGRLIKIITAIKGLRIVYDSEMDLWTDVLAVYDREAKKRGYGISISYVDIRRESIEDTIAACSAENIAGVILMATELDAEEVKQFERIPKPMMIYDNESPDSMHSCVVADNYLGVHRAAEFLLNAGHRKILYFAHTAEIYNFRQRRNGFCTAMLEHNLNPYQNEQIISMGSTIEETHRNMCRYLETHDLPDACIFENYQVSIGVMRAFREHHVSVPAQISAVGVDLVPSYMTGDCPLAAVRIPHTERAVLTMILLEKEIEEASYTKSRVMTNCRLIEGESVKRKV